MTHTVNRIINSFYSFVNYSLPLPAETALSCPLTLDSFVKQPNFALEVLVLALQTGLSLQDSR
jgi:hypothetical protein